MFNLTRPQKLVYDMDKFASGTIANICGSVFYPGEKPEDVLADAVEEIYRLNDALRIRIIDSSEGPKQKVVPYTPVGVNVLRFESNAEFDEYASGFAKTPIITSGPLCEMCVVILPGKYGILGRFHHLICDAWTIVLVGSQYYSLVNGSVPEAYSYIDYLEKEKQYLESSRFEKDRSFFLEQFKRCDEVTYLSDKQNTSFSSSRKTFVIEKDEAATITEYCAKAGTSQFVLFMTALAAYINRIKMNTERFYIGTAVLNRTGPVDKNTMGMFINTVPVLIELANESSFAENLKLVERSAMSILRHQRFNYGDVLAALRKEYGFSEKLYDIIISYQNAALIGNDCESYWHHSGMQTESLQVHIDDHDSEGIFRIHYDYLNELFSEKEIEQMHARIVQLLFDAIENDSKKLHELRLLTQDEQQRLLKDFNNTSFKYSTDKCIHRLFEEQAEAIPDNPAVVAFDKTVSYRELNEEANSIAHYLLKHGIGKGDIVAVILPRCSHLIPAMFGVLKAGAAYMPVDPSYPEERKQYLLTESAAKLVISDENIEELCSTNDRTDPKTQVSPDDLFCALHTSGSTGKPKLTLLTQKNLLNFLYACGKFWDGVDTAICVTIVTFDIFMQETLLSLALGKKVVLASEEQIYNQSAFEAMFENEENVTFFSTPTKLTAYIKGSEIASFLQKIKTLIVGGEVFTDELYDLLQEKINMGHVRNGYGPAETTIGASYTGEVPPPEKRRLRILNGYGPTETTLGISFF